MDLKKRVQELCKEKNVTSQQLEIDLGFGKGYISKLNTSVPNASKIQQIADYLEVPLDFLLGRPPFDHWERINQNRQEFLRYVAEDPETLDMIWSIDSAHPELTPAKDFISMLSLCVESAVPNDDGSWSVILRRSYQSKEKAPALTDKDHRDIARDLERIMEALDTAGDLQFDGDPMSDEARESIRAAMKLGLEAAKVKNKERFTPRKYRKE